MLKERLQQVANLIEEDSLIDIGTDHGYLIIDLLQKQVITTAMAVEITKGPLTNVTTNIKNHRLSSQVECVLSDGLKSVSEQQANNYQAVSICGMGGTLIAKIIEESIEKFANKTLYLQPNNGEMALRSKLIELGFTITNELVIVDNEIYYEIIKAVPGKSSLNDKELYFGPINLTKMTGPFIEKYKKHHQHLTNINGNLMNKNIKNQKIIDELSLIEGVLNEIIKAN